MPCKNATKKIKIIIATLASVAFLTGLVADRAFASVTDGTIDNTHKYAWSENAGWLNFGCLNCNVRITDSALTGYVWSENYGWINLAPTKGGVKNDGEGILSGYAWGESLGWINFSGVTINSVGKFSGSASGDISGQINFDCANCAVKTSWRPKSARPSLGGGGMPPEWHNLPTPPVRGFRILINNNAKYTDNFTVVLDLSGGPNTERMAISNNPEFLGIGSSGQIPYQSSYQWNLCRGRNSCPEGEYTVYVKFFAPWGKSSKTFSDSIIYRETLIEEVLETLRPLVPGFLRPRPPAVKPPEKPIEELVPQETPLALQGKWQLLPEEPIERFVLAPLPREIRALAQKFPELGETLRKVGVTTIADIKKLATVKLTLPGLTERVGLPTIKIEPGRFALPKGVPVAELLPEIKQELPTNIVFARTSDELIDFNTTLTIDAKGEPQQTITTILGQPLQLVVKPDNPVKSIKGYLAFKSRSPRPTSFQLPFNRFTASLVFANPVFAQPQERPIRVEEVLVLMEFEYTDPDGDGIYIAEIQIPPVEGRYEVITVMDFENPELGKKEIRLITIIDPEGYIYEKDGNKETRIPGAIVSIYWLNPETKQYELWPAEDYQQENPQITDVRGTYSFLVPEGYYYLKVEAPGYLVYEGKPFQVKEGSGVHINIELKTKYWWLNIIDWQTILLVIAIILLLYNFYRDKIREKLAKHQKSNLI